MPTRSTTERSSLGLGPKGASSLFVLALALMACGGDGGAESETALPLGAPTGLSDTPTLTVGERSGDPDHELHRVVSPFLLPDGQLGVPLADDGAIRVFDANGELDQVLGAPGEGPGEFMGLSAVWTRGDTVEVFDGELSRVTRFAPGEEPETIPLEGVASAQSGVPGSALESGGWLLYGVKEVQQSGRDRLALHRFASDGTHVEELSEVDGFRRHVHAMGRGPDPISPRPLFRSEGDRVYMAETLTPRVTELDAFTGDRREVEWLPARDVSSDDAIRLAREASASFSSPMPEEWVQANFTALTGDEAVSAFWDFLVDGDEFLWVREYDPAVHGVITGGLDSSGSGGTWRILDRDGTPVTTVTVPEDFEPLRIHDDRLVGVRRDELDVESVRVYEIERAGS